MIAPPPPPPSASGTVPPLSPGLTPGFEPVAGPPEELRAVVHEAVREALIAYLPAASHQDHHDWVESQIAQQRERQASWLRVRESVAGWMIIGVLGAIGAAIWHYFQEALTTLGVPH